MRPVSRRTPDGGDAIDARRRDEETQRRGDTGRRRADHARDAELPRDLLRVDGPRAAGAEERVVARVAPALGDVHARGGGHVLVDDVVDAPGDLDRVEPQRAGEPLDRLPRRREIHLDLAAGEVAGVEVAEEEIRVGHGRLRPAEAVGGGTGLGARAPRPDLEEPDLVHGGDAAAARADLDQLDRRDPDGQAAAFHEALLARRLEAVGRQRLALVHERELGGGAAHVEREQLPAAVGAAEERAGERAGSGAGLEHLHGRPLGFGDVGQAAAREHEEKRGRDAEPIEPLRHQREVALGERLDVRVGDGRRGALVLADLGRDLVGGRHRDLRMALGDEARGLRLVRAGWRRRAGTPPRWTRPRPGRAPARGSRAASCRGAARRRRRRASARRPRGAGCAGRAARAWRSGGRTARTCARARSRACRESPPS